MSTTPPPTGPPTPPMPPQPPMYGAAPVTPMNPSDEKMWATLIHVGGVFGLFLPSLIGYLVLKDRGPFIRSHTMTALNFQITVLIATVVGSALTAIFIGFIVLFAVWILNIIFSIIAALAANRGQFYSYPLTIKFLS
ncbi:DUF4870 domain-containing protein [Cryobacterium melibiosiphilum]|nr:DUF4870 domain-containing protein [Cryobacterium melibiosiphilum]